MTTSPPFRRVLIANRGEIAVRVARAVRESGGEAVAVYSDPDRNAAHVLAADIAEPLGGETAAESYLDIDKVLAAARAAGAEAIHPGYGFLSENAAFARAVDDAGLVFLGPSADAMAELGSKQRARAVAQQAKVPVVPGLDDADPEAPDLQQAAERIGYPVMVKASGGGGGKGMRVVADPGELREALAAGRREAEASFGDGRMILEKVIHPARHVEVQIAGDRHGNVVSFHERECSVQRRHQKVLEEAPSPAVGDKLRKAMGKAAVGLAKAVGYCSAGTVEFLLDADGRFYFLEVNTRLQVEHPVTELVTGIDLVQLQLQIAAGRPLPELLAGRDLAPRGHAIEARIYAEVPEQGFLPAAGTLLAVREPEGPGIRVDSGVHTGSEVSVHYDPLLAKLIVHAPDRTTACARLALALREACYLGIPTNVDFLRRVVEDEGFRNGDLRTDFLDLRPELVRGSDGEPPDEVFVGAALCGLLAGSAGAAAGAAESAPLRTDPWDRLAALRLWRGGPR